MAQEKTLIGRAERINFPTLGIKNVPAKIDTGADFSSLWCSKIEIVEGHLTCVLFAKSSPYYTGQIISFKSSDIDLTRVSNSFGHTQLRYKVKIPMEVKGRTIKTTFTLTDRSTKLYPILIGRSTLQGKFLVDVSLGRPLDEEEAISQKRLRAEMKRVKKEMKL